MPGEPHVDGERERADPIRNRISVEGARSRSAIVMNMNDEPQIAASAASIRRWRRLTLSHNAAAAVVLPV